MALEDRYIRVLSQAGSADEHLRSERTQRLETRKLRKQAEEDQDALMEQLRQIIEEDEDDEEEPEEEEGTAPEELDVELEPEEDESLPDEIDPEPDAEAERPKLLSHYRDARSRGLKQGRSWAKAAGFD